MNAAVSLVSHGSAASGVLLCFSHLRWNLVFQRPQHLMTQFAQRMPVIVWEEPDFADIPAPELQVRAEEPGVRVATPRMPQRLAGPALEAALAGLLRTFLKGEPPVKVRWYYTPMMVAFSRDLEAACTVYD